MPNDHTRAIPQLEALEFVFPLGKQRVGLRNGLFIGKTGELLEGLDTPPAHEVASHAVASLVKKGVAHSSESNTRSLCRQHRQSRLDPQL
jgi:hypothetical protein